MLVAADQLGPLVAGVADSTFRDGSQEASLDEENEVDGRRKLESSRRKMVRDLSAVGHRLLVRRWLDFVRQRHSEKLSER